jgi:hypothetical protein
MRRALGRQPYADRTLNDLWDDMHRLEAKLDEARRAYNERREYDTQYDLMVKAWFASSWNDKTKKAARHARK